MSEAARFYKDGREMMAEPYHYKMCGLDDIYLLNGFKIQTTEYGQGVSVENAQELHKEIGRFLILNRKALSRKEIKFLRKEMEVTQEDLGQCLGVTGQTVARYEKGETEIPGPVDKLIRFLYAFHLLPEEQRAKFLEEVMKAQEELREIDEKESSPIYFGATDTGWDEVRREAA